MDEVPPPTAKTFRIKGGRSHHRFTFVPCRDNADIRSPVSCQPSKYLIITLLFLLAMGWFPVHGQLRADDFYFMEMGGGQGLSNRIVNHVMQDSEGVYWAGTHNGLNYFDGIRWNPIKAGHGDPSTLASNVVHGLCEGKDGVLWCVTNAGVSKFYKHENRFQHYKLFRQPSGTYEHSTMFEIVSTAKGKVVVNGAHGVYDYDAARDTFVYHALPVQKADPEKPLIYKNGLVNDPGENAVWIGSSKGLFYFNVSTGKFTSAADRGTDTSLFSHHRVSALSVNEEGELLFVDVDAAKIVMVHTTFRTVRKRSWLKDDPFIATSFADKSGNLWFCSWNNKLYFLPPKAEIPETFSHRTDYAYSISGTFFNSVFQDQQGTLFFGTNNGISMSNPALQFFKMVRLPKDVVHQKQYYQSILLGTDKDDNVWLAPSYQYLLKYHTPTGNFKKYMLFSEKESGRMNDLLITTMSGNKERLYFGTAKGLFCYDFDTDHFEKFDNAALQEEISGKYILAMCINDQGELFFTSHHNGLYHVDTKKGSFKHYVNDSTDAKSLPGDYIYALHAGNENGLWISSEDSGLVFLDTESGRCEYPGRDPSGTLPAGVNLALAGGDDGELLLMNHLSGLYSYHPRNKKAEPILLASKFSNLTYNHMMSAAHLIWMNFYDEFTIADPLNGHVSNFKIEMCSGETDYVNKLFPLHHGRAVAELCNGFVIIDKNKLVQPNTALTFNFTGFSTPDTFIAFPDLTNVLKLSSGTNSFSINFSSPLHVYNANLLFAYKLQGVDEDWVDCGSRQTAYYTNLDGGNYTLWVRAKGPDGVWHTAKKPLQLIVHREFYKTIGFRVGLLLLLAICLIWYGQLRKKKERRVTAEKAIAYFAESGKGKNKVEDILRDIAGNVITRTDLVDCVIYLIDQERNVLVQTAAYGKKSPDMLNIVDPIEIPVGTGIVGHVAATGRPEMIGDTREDPRYIPDDQVRLSEMAVPILSEGRVIGVIDSEHPQKNFFKEEHLSLLTTIASISGTKIVKAQQEVAIREKERRLEELKNQVFRLRQQALQAQMNPHFIFNCLNSINGFILQNEVDAASTYLIKFSRLIRMILEHSDEKYISLQNELDALRLYIEMETLRFTKKFSYSMEVDPEINTDVVMVPPLIIQPFVENAIWHGLLHKESPGKLLVSVYQKNGMMECIIDDDGVGRDAAMVLKSKSTGDKKSLGLKLTVERLRLMQEQEGRVGRVEVIDKKNAAGQSSGTRIVICFDRLI